MPHSTLSNKNPWVETPLVESATLSKAAGCRIFLKLENLQPSGSFKSRGVGHYIQQRLAESPNPSLTHFYSSSGGNAGLACVHAARSLGRPATVVVPMSTKPLMLAKLRAAGAHAVLQHGASWKEADAYLRETVLPSVAQKSNGQVLGVYVPPFDHPDIWTGNATLVEEVASQMTVLCGETDADGEDASTPDVMVCSVGGGGLLNGIIQGIETLAPQKWSDGKQPTLVAVETAGADSFSQSLLQKKHVTLPAITSIATSLGCVKVSRRLYEYATEEAPTAGAKTPIKSVVLGDDEAAMGCWRLADDERLVVEPACGVNVALCYGGRLERALGRPVGKDEKVVIVVCGGSAITIDQLAQFKRDFGHLGDEVGAVESKTVASAVDAGV